MTVSPPAAQAAASAPDPIVILGSLDLSPTAASVVSSALRGLIDITGAAIEVTLPRRKLSLALPGV